MYWNENVVQKLEWNGEISHLEEKQKTLKEHEEEFIRKCNNK